MALSRRELMGTAAAAAGLTAGLPKAFAREDAISIALASRSPNGVNPQQTGLTGGDSWAIRQVFDNLVNPDPGTFAVRPEDFRPSLAESWESSPDARTWTYQLRRGVPFHKGYGEMTSEDVAFTFGRQLDPKLVTNQKVLYANVEAVEAPDRHVVRFKLKRPDPFFNGSVVSTLGACILSRKAFEEIGDDFKLRPVGTGPFEVDSVDERNGVAMSAFGEHFAGVAAWPHLKVAFIADTTARTLAFAAGEVDMIEGVRSPGWIPTMRQRDPKTIFDATAPGSFNSLHLNLTRPPLDDLRVRQAIRYAIDNAALAAAYGELSTPMVGIIASQFPGSVRKADLPPELRYDPDPARAKALLAEAGHPNGVTIPCFTSQREDYASIMLMIQEQLRAASINLDLKIIDHSTFHADNRKDKNTLTLWSSSYPPVPTQPILSQLAAAGVVKADGTGQTNFSHYGVAMPGIDAMVEKLEDEPDFARRIAIVEAIETQILRDLPLLGIITLSYVVARNPRVDLGFPVRSGYAYWPLDRARRV
jgi:peptide/nickel transport system substrate-binding protein